MCLNQSRGQTPQTSGGMNPLQAKMEAIRAALLLGEPVDTIVARLGTTPQAVENIRRGMGRAALRPSRVVSHPSVPYRCTAYPANSPYATRYRMETVRQEHMPASEDCCPWRGRFVSIDGTNVAGWSRRRGEPRLVQTLAICRWFDRHHVKYVCWFDANFRHCVEQWSRHNGVGDAEALGRILAEQPDLFKQAPAGVAESGRPIKADPFILRDASSVPNGLILSCDLYRLEAQTNPELFGWTQRHPDRRITGGIAANGDVFLGANAEVRIPVVDDVQSYIG